MEILTTRTALPAVKAVLFDFDGTLSTLRYGWEEIMRPMMNEFICDSKDSQVDDEVVAYIDKSTGIQTIFQMEWLCQRVKEYRTAAALPMPNQALDSWGYKEEYLQRLMALVGQRRKDVHENVVRPERYHIKGSQPFLNMLHSKGIKIYLASGTDDADVKCEAQLLGFAHYFTDIKGAGTRSRLCGKEAVLKALLEHLDADTLAVFGDGKVEIELGKQMGARTIGVASNEAQGHGVDLAKRDRLIQAGADVLIGDFSDVEAVSRFLGL